MTGKENPRTSRAIACCLVTAAVLLTSGCAARFSPGTIRDEIERQRGQDPLSVFEVPEEDRPAMILIRGDDESVGDLVVVGAGRSRVVYGRLSGTLSADLPAAVGDAMREGGPDEVKRIFMQLSETPSESGD